MKVLLHEDIERLGFFGDVVEVKNGYARNYLLPQGLAVVPTDAAVKAVQKEKAKKAEERRLRREQMEKVAAAVEGQEVVIEALANEIGHLFGSVTEAEIAHALQEKGHEVKKKAVVLPEHLRQIGDYDITIRFALDLEATVKVRIVVPNSEQTQAPSKTKATDGESQSAPTDE